MSLSIALSRKSLAPLLFAVLFLTAAAWSDGPGYRHLGGPYPDDPLEAVLYQLDNGLMVYLSVNRDTPRFFAEIAVRAGSKHDPPETTGLAHYMEHLLFKGSERLGTLDYEAEKEHLERIEALYEDHFNEADPDKRSEIYAEITRESERAAAYALPNELDRTYRAMGGRDLNAHTWHEEVVYKVSLPTNQLEQWAILESDRFTNPVFRLFQTELETVYEEMNRALDNKNRIIQYAVNEVLFKTHPYGQQPTLGLVEHLRTPSIKRINAFYDTWYAPNNMAIFISGDIDVHETMEIIARHFSTWTYRELPEQPVWEEEPLEGREKVRVGYRAEKFVLLAFRTAPKRHEDAEVLMMLDMILDNAVAGLINLNLNQQQRVREAGAFPMLQNDYGTQYLYGIPKDGQTMEEVEQLLLEQLALIRKGEFDDWLIPAIINDYKKREKTSLETDTARVALMRRSWIAFEPWEQAARIIARMEKVTREDVIRVANQYFQDNYVAGFREDTPHDVPQVEKPPMPDITLDTTQQSPFAVQVLNMPVEPLSPVFIEEDKQFHRVEGDKGIVVYHAPNPINDVFSFSLVVNYGTRQDNRMAIAARLMQRTGTQSLSAEALQIAWYRLGTDFSISVEEDQTVISLVGLDSEFEASLALLSDMLVTPQADAGTLDELKRIILAQREDAKKEPQQLSSALVEYNRIGEDSLWLNMLPAQDVLALGVDELQQVLRTALGHRHYALYSGTHEAKKILAMLEALQIHEAPLAPPPPFHVQEVRAPDASEIYFLDREMAQSHVRIEFGSVPYTPDISAAAQLYNTYFAGGMAGIVFQELRETRALAYVVGARYRMGTRANDPNIMLGVIQTQADKTIEAIDAFIELLDELPVSEDRYRFARESLLNDYRANRIGFREIPRVLLDWELRGLTPDPRRAWFAEIQEAETMDLLMEFHKQYITHNPKLISVVGETVRLDMAGLEEIAPVRVVTESEIFVD